MTLLIDNTPIESFDFSGGEIHLRLDAFKLSDTVQVTALLTDSREIMKLLLTINAIRNLSPLTSIHLTLPYFPYARQDRVCNPGEAFGAQVVANLINSLDCASVRIIDPHSNVTLSLVRNAQVIAWPDLISGTSLESFIKKNKLSLVAPDAGAKEKTAHLAQHLGLPFFVASKKRDPATGKILASEIHENISELNLLIVDDICDGGQTFISLAEQLKKQGAQNLYLYVTHGIFSKGFEALTKNFKKIFCYQTINPKHPHPEGLVTILNKENS
jgi:ribose-phosphate pyrophosphokinase